MLARLRKLDRQHGVPPKAPETLRKSIVPNLLYSKLFMVWGLVYGMLDIMNEHIAQAMELQSKHSSLLATSYYSAYLWVPTFVAGKMIERAGYRITAVFGLTMVALGALVFAVAGHFLSFELMCFGQLISGVGVASLERTANPYMTNCGPVRYRTARLLYGQSFAALGTVIAPQIAKGVLYGGSPTEEDAGKCVVGQGWTSATIKSSIDLGPTITLYYTVSGVVMSLVVIYAIIFFGTHLVPELPQPSTPKWTHSYKFWKHPIFSLRYTRLWIGCFVNFFNLGDQVTVAQFIIPTLTINACLTTKAATDMFKYAQILFLFGRLLPTTIVMVGFNKSIRNSFISILFKSQTVLWLWLAAAVSLSALTATVKGSALPWIAAFIMFCEAPSFPMIFEAATADLRQWSTLGETIMVTSIAGGMVGPPAFGAIRDSFHISSGWWLVFALFLVVLLFPTLTMLVPSWRSTVDLEEQAEESEKPSVTEISARAVDISES